jgi:hypothetical protein
MGLILLAALTLLGLAAALTLGAMSVDLATDPTLGCFDHDDDPACSDTGRHEHGLSAIRTSSWILAGVAASSGAAALVLALRRRPTRARAVATGLLCAITWVLAATLWSRL